MTIVSLKLKIIIDRAIVAPAHGKDFEDGLNDRDKDFWWKN